MPQRDDDREYVRHASPVSWPTDPVDLTSTERCPACFRLLRSTVCGGCGLDLSNPVAAELLAASQEASRALDRRVALIGRMRIEARAARASAASQVDPTAAPARIPPAPAARTAPASAPPRPAPAPVPQSFVPPSVTPPSMSAEDAGQAPPLRRGSSVQVVLLIIGVSLLSIGAIFFLVFAFINFGLLWRSVIIGGLTAAAFVVATLLARRRLRATAEDIAAFAVVLVYLDAFAVRANDFFGTEAVEALTWWGGVVLVASVGFGLWHRASRLRVPSVAGFLGVPPGAALLVGGLTSPLDDPLRVQLSFLAMAVGGLVHVLVPLRPRGERPAFHGTVERSFLLGTTLVALAGAGTTAPFVADGDPVAVAIAFVAVAVAAAAHLAALIGPASRIAGVRAWIRCVAVALGTAPAVTGFAVVVTGDELRDVVILPLLTAAATALALDAAVALGRAPTERRRLLGLASVWGAASAAVVGVPALLISASVAATAGATAVTRGLADPLALPGTATLVDPDGTVVLAVAALAAVAVLSAVAWAATGRLRQRAPVLGWSAAVVSLLAVPLTGVAWAVVALWLALGAAALVALLLLAGRGVPLLEALRPPLVGVLVGGTSLGWTAAWAGDTTWAPAALAAIGVALGARRLLPSPAHDAAPVDDSAAVGGATPVGAAPDLHEAAPVDGTGAADTRGTALGPWRASSEGLASGRAALGALAAALLLIAVATGARQVSAGPDAVAVDWVPATLRSSGLVAALLVIAAAVPWRRATTTDRRAVVALGGPVALLAGLLLRSPDPTVALDSPIAHLVGDAALLVAAVVWATLAPTRLRGERVAASIVLAPATWLLADTVVRSAALPPQTGAVAAGLAAVLVAALSLTASDAGVGRALHRPRELGVVLVAAGAVIGVLTNGGDLGWLAVALSALALVLSSIDQRAGGASAVLLGAAALLVPLAAGLAAYQLIPGDPGVGRVGLLSATLLVAVAALPLGRVADRLDRRVVFWVSSTVAGALALLLRAGSGPDDRSVENLGIWAVLLAAIVLFSASPATRGLKWERNAASIALGPAVLLLVDSFVRSIDAASFVRSVAPVTAALLTAAGSLAVAALRPSSLRLLRDAGVALVGVPAAVVAALDPSDATWLALVLAGVAALLVATSADGLFASRSPRRLLGWVALALVVAGLWWRLGDDDVDRVEAYVLPVAGLLLLVALLMWRAERRPGARVPSGAPDAVVDAPVVDGGSAGRTAPSPRASALVWLAALLVAVLPIGVASAAGAGDLDDAPSLIRAVITCTAAAALVLIGAFAPAGRSRLRPYLDGAALAGAVGLLVVAVGRALVLVATRPSDLELDLWLAVALVLLVAAAMGLTRVPADAVAAQRRLAARVLAVGAVGAVAAVEAWAVSVVDVGAVRPLLAVLVLSAVHVLSFLVDRSPFDRGVAWLALGGAVVVGLAAITAGTLEPVELWSAPVAIALLATGSAHLAQTPPARSWPWLGPGTAVLLIPSLAATIEDRPLWRLVGLGVVAVGVVVIAVVRRLQAPFTMATVVVLVHAVATFTPQVRAVYESVEWWLWLVIGGVLIIALAARYEQRMQNLRDAVGRFSALR